VLRVAVASKDGIAISEHFGHAKKFYIYDVSMHACNFLEQREVSHYCLGGHSDKGALAGILETIKDCAAVFVAKIGDGPTDKLNARGIQAITDYTWEEIEPSLLDYISRLETENIE
jgi:predicted Fe-Mo cluster-binding NifX family protein